MTFEITTGSLVWYVDQAGDEYLAKVVSVHDQSVLDLEVCWDGLDPETMFLIQYSSDFNLNSWHFGEDI